MVGPVDVECLLRGWTADFRLSSASGSIAPIAVVRRTSGTDEFARMAVIRGRYGIAPSDNLWSPVAITV